MSQTASDTASNGAARSAKLEGEATRIRRKSRDLAEEFQKLMGPKLEAVFKEMDEDGSGNLDASELEKAFAAAGRPSDPET